MTKLEEMLGRARSLVILGHINPDGDCVGACLARRFRKSFLIFRDMTRLSRKSARRSLLICVSVWTAATRSAWAGFRSIWSPRTAVCVSTTM